MPEYPKQVRTTMQPDVVLEVGEHEYIDLSRQGLLIDESRQSSPSLARKSKEEGK